MRDSMPCLPLTFAPFLLAALLQGTTAQAGTFLIDGTAAGLSGPVHNNGVMIGMVGDFVELADGDHMLSFEGPHQHGLTLSMKVRGDTVRLVGTASYEPECGEIYNITWPEPRVESDRDHAGVTRLNLAPVRAEATGQTTCVQYMLAGCTQQKAIVEVRSDPPGGEIWFPHVYGGWEKQDFRTNVTLSVPFCEGSQSKQVLIRMAGRVNCLENLPVAPEARLKVDCALRVPGEPDPLETSAPPN